MVVPYGPSRRRESSLTVAVLFHQVAILRELGHGPGAVATAMAGMALGGIAGTLLTGPLLERLPARLGLASSLALLTAALAIAALGPTGSLLPWVYGTMPGWPTARASWPGR